MTESAGYDDLRNPQVAERWPRSEHSGNPFIGATGYPVRDHPTIYRCPATLVSGVKCPMYLNHDGNGYLYCTDEARHAE